MTLTVPIILAFAMMNSASEQPLAGKVEVRQGRPTIVINDESLCPMLYALTEGGRFTWQEVPQRNLRNFAKLGFRLYQIDVWMNRIWSPEGKLNIDEVRRQIRGMLDACPEAAVFLRVHVRAPDWWLDAHPDEITQFADAPVDPHGGDLNRGRRASFASQAWRDAAKAKLVDFCKQVSDLPEGDRVVGMHLANGVYGEWHYWSFLNEPDTGVPMTEHFRQWLREKYGTDEALRKAWHDNKVALKTADVPNVAERSRSSAGYFYDPQKADRKMIDYGQCHQGLVADCIIDFCKTAKENWPRPLITGVFAGYYFSTRNLVNGCHVEFDRLLASPFIDYFSAPFSYESDSRWLGGSAHFRTAVESVTLHGKLWLSEMDQGSFLGGAFPAEQPPQIPADLPDSIATLRRNVAQSLLRGQGLWFYDFGPHGKGGAGWWDQPELLSEIGRLKRLADDMLTKPHRPAANVLMVYDMKSAYYCCRRTEQDFYGKGWFWHGARNRTMATAHHSGAMIDTVFLPDLDRVDWSRYKVVIFVECPYITSAQRDFIRDKVMKGGRHVVWTYTAGYTDGETISLDRMNDLMGFRLKPVAVNSPARIRVTGLGVLASEYPIMEGYTRVATHLDYRGHQDLPAAGYPVDRLYAPVFAVDDPQATTLGTFKETAQVALAKKRLPDCTVWYTAMPLTDMGLMRAIFREAGAHVYVDTDDVVLATRDMICIHIVTGGPRRIALPSGAILTKDLPPRSTSLLAIPSGKDMLAQ